MRSVLGSAFMALLLLPSAATALPGGLTERQSNVKIMALGDSITGSPVSFLLRLGYLW